MHAIEAERLFAVRDGYNFDHFYGALDRDSLFELALAAQADGREADRVTLMQRTAAATAPRPAP